MYHRDDPQFFTNTPTDWNFNPLVDNPKINPYTNQNFANNALYDGMKYNAVIMLKEIIKQSNNIFSDDILEYVNKKCLQGSKTHYHTLLSITAHLFHYALASGKPINYKSFRRWCLKNPFYHDSFKEKKLEDFEGDDDYEIYISRNDINLDMLI